MAVTNIPKEGTMTKDDHVEGISQLLNLVPQMLQAKTAIAIPESTVTNQRPLDSSANLGISKRKFPDPLYTFQKKMTIRAADVASAKIERIDSPAKIDSTRIKKLFSDEKGLFRLKRSHFN